MTTRRDLLRFLDRPWDLLRERKDRHVATFVGDDVERAFAIADALRAHALESGALPRDDDAGDDLATAVRIRRLLDRAARRRRRSR